MERILFSCWGVKIDAARHITETERQWVVAFSREAAEQAYRETHGGTALQGVYSIQEGPVQWVEESSQPSIECSVCHRVSYHPKDIEERYCGNCHAFHADLVSSVK